MDVVALKCPECEGIHLSPLRSATGRANCPHCSYFDRWEIFTEVPFPQRSPQRTPLPAPKPRPIAQPPFASQDIRRPSSPIAAGHECRAEPSHASLPDDPEAGVGSREEQANLLAFFYDGGVAPTSDPSDDARSIPLQNLENPGDVSACKAKPRKRGSERLLLTVALHIGAAMFIGAFVFIQVEDSLASTRQVADVEEIEVSTHQRARELYERERALLTAQQALTQPSWTELLPFICDSRRLLPEIRDYYERWPYAPFTNPDLTFVRREEDGASCAIHLRLDADKPWSRLVIMEKEGDTFKLDWEAFQRLESHNLQEDNHILEDPFLQSRIEEQERQVAPYFGQATRDPGKLPVVE